MLVLFTTIFIHILNELLWLILCGFGILCVFV